MSRASVDWHGFQLPAARKALLLCSGGILYSPATQHPRYTNLPYGRRWRHGAFTCTSAITGMTCRNRAGHGVFLSRLRWRTF
jgi:hypothetical protein